MNRYLHTCLLSLLVFLSLSVFSKPAHARLTANPNSINFGNQPVGSGGLSIPVTLTNTDLSRSFTIVSVNSSDEDFSLTGASLPALLPPGQSLTVYVAFTPSSSQSYSGTLGFTTYYGWTVNVPLSGVGLQGQSGNQLSVDPPLVDFGSVAPGSTGTQLLKLSNRTGSAIAVNGVTTMGPDFSLLGFSPGMAVEPGQTLVLTIDFSPSAAENATGQLFFSTNAPDRPIWVGWSGQSALPGPASLNNGQIGISPASLNFSTVNVGGGNTQSFTITNNGSAPVTLMTLSVTGPDMFIGGWGDGWVIEPGQSVSPAATFSPQSAENVSGSISLFIDALGSPIQIPWTGSGGQPQASIASAQSLPSTATAQPQIPSSTSVVNDDVSLLWSPSTSSGVIGYNIYRGTVSGGPYNLITPIIVTAPGYVDTAVNSGQNYYYVVTSVAPGGVESSFSPEAAAAVP